MIEEGKNLVGLHAVVEYSSCDLSTFCLLKSSTEKIISTWIELLKSIEVTTLGTHIHFFGPNSISLSLNLSESHLNFHTWPEFSYVAFDFFCCKKDENLKAQMQLVIDETAILFGSKSVKSIWVERGFGVSF